MLFKPKPAVRLAAPFHAVTIIGGETACAAARALRQKRFLSAQAPLLPLAQCAFPTQCQCRYQHLQDRRSTLRRDRDRGGLPFPYSGREKRHNPLGRRADDKI